MLHFITGLFRLFLEEQLSDARCNHGRSEVSRSTICTVRQVCHYKAVVSSQQLAGAVHLPSMSHFLGRKFMLS
jgi:hypothetical protein